MSCAASYGVGSSPPTSTSTGTSDSSGCASTSSQVPLLPLVPLSIVTSSYQSVKVGVLLDGDADLFTRAYTSKGRQGGRCAALELKSSVERYIRKEFWHNSKDVQIDVVAFSFVNSKGLSNLLGDDIQSFAQGFNSSPFAFTMSDVGDISQGVDTALKSHLPFLLSTCDHVLFGGTHDAGYVSVLSTAAARDKVTLVRTTPYCAEKILMLGLDEVRFPGIFEGRDPTERARRSFVSSERSGPVSYSGGSAEVHESPVAPRSYSNVAASPLALTPPSTASPAAGSPSSTYDFKPLVRLLLMRALPPHSNSRPLRGGLAYELKSLADPPIDFTIPKEFRKYSLEAERCGIVQLGVGAFEGSEWIKLNMSHAHAREYIKESPSGVVSTAISSSVLTSVEDETPSFCVLVQVLRSCPDSKASFSIVSSRMIDRGAKLWPHGEFAAYVEKAVKARIVDSGCVEGERFEFWVQLTPQYRLSRSSSASSPPVAAAIRAGSAPTYSRFMSASGGHASETIPTKFVPLVEAFVSGRISAATPHSLASRLTSGGNKPFESGKWQEYLDEAKRCGIIKISSQRDGVQWVKLIRAR